MAEATQTTGEVLHDLPEITYHAQTGLGEGLYVTRSMICDYLESPRGFYLRHMQRVPEAAKDWSRSLNLGSVVDAILSGTTDLVQLAPEEHLTPSGLLSTKKATQIYLDEQGALGITVCDLKTWELGQLLAREADRHPICKRLIERTSAHQVTLRWTDPKTGLRLQTRPDRLAGGLCWADDKTTRKPLRSFMSAVAEYGYDIQQVMAMDGAAACGLEPLPFCFLVLQTTYPFDVAVMRLPQRVVENAYARLHRALAGISAQEFGTADLDLREVDTPFWWSAQFETMEGGAA